MYPRSMADSDCVVIQGSNMAEGHRVAFRHVRSLNHHTVGISHATGIHGRGPPPESGPQPGDAGAVSDSGLVLDRDDAQAAQELLLDVVPLVVEGCPAQREDRGGAVHELAVLEPLDECLVARLLHELRHPVHGAVEIPYLPLGGAGCAVEHLGRAIRVDVQLIDGRPFGAEGALAVRAPRVAFDVDDLSFNGVHERGAPYRAVGADAGRGLGVLDSRLLRPGERGGEAHPQTRESSQCRAGEGTRGQVEEVSPREIHAAYPVLPSCSSLSMIVASTKGSSATSYRVLPERTSVNHGPCELRRVTRFPLLTTVPDHVPA